MVRLNSEFYSPKDLLENRFPNEVRLLKIFIEKSVLLTSKEKIQVRKAFRDVGLFESLNQEREKNDQDPYEQVANVSWLEIATFAEEKFKEEATVKKRMTEERDVWLVKLAEQDAEEELEAEAIRFEGKGFEKSEPMSRGPEEKRKWYTSVPYEYLPMNRTKYRVGGPTELDPEDYQRLKLERSHAIGELFAKNLQDQRKRLANKWLEKKYAGDLTKINLIDQALDGKPVQEIPAEDIAHAWSAADANMDVIEIMRQRNDATTRVDYDLGWYKIERKKIENPRTGKKLSKNTR